MSTYDAQYEPKGIFPLLPLEPLHVVAAHADPNTLTQMCLVNSVMGNIAVMYLYADVRLTKPSVVVKCLKTMSKHSELAKHARVLSICLESGYPCLTSAFGELLRRALHHMPHLVTLELDLGGDTFVRHLRGCPFRITNLSLACGWDPHLPAWLEEQPAILRFMLYGDHRSTVSLTPSALPKLRCIFGTPTVISTIVPGRPVKQVFVTVYSRTPFSEQVIEHLAQSCKLSTGPVDAVSVIHQNDLAPNPDEMFGILSSIPLYLPGLKKFAMQAYSCPFNEALCGSLRRFISGFRQLKYLDLFTKERRGEVMKDNETKLSDLARSFGKQCPSLRSIRFSPDSFYAYYPNSDWISICDLTQLHENIIRAYLLALESLQRTPTGSVNSAAQSSVVPVPVSPILRTPLLPDIRDMGNTLTMLNAALRWRPSTAVRCLDLSSPEMDADLCASVLFGYETCSRLLRRVQGLGQDRSTISV